MAQKLNYYEVLGVERNATEDEVKSAYRKLAKENHPDVRVDLTDDQRKKREEKLREITVAGQTLNRKDKRADYDAELKREDQAKKTVESGNVTGFEGIFNGDLFKGMGNMNIDFSKAFGGLGGAFSNDFGFGSKRGSKKDASFMIPENDWGLLAGLKTAYSAKEDGVWRIKKSELDTREWMPKNLYTVTREKGNVHVFRTIIDWRDGRDRDSDIEVRIEGNYFEREKLKPKNFLGEYYLYGEGKNKLVDSYQIPSDFGNYLHSMKSLAKKFADNAKNNNGSYDVNQELQIINTYGEYGSRNTRIEGGIWKDDVNREWVKEVKFENFWDKLKQAEGRVVMVEGTKSTPEGQAKSTFQGSSSEARG